MLLDKVKVGGVITVLDKDGNVKSKMKIVSVETKEDKQDGTQQHSS